MEQNNSMHCSNLVCNIWKSERLGAEATELQLPTWLSRKLLPMALLQTGSTTRGTTTYLVHGIHTSMVHEGPRAMVC